MKRFFEKFDLWLGSAVLILMVSITVIQVIFRKAGNPLSWPEEGARWTMIWVTFAGASYCFKNGGLIKVEYFVQKIFPQKVQNIIAIVNMAIMGVFFAYLGYSSVNYMLLTISKGQVYNVTRLPYAIVIFALVLGSVLCMLFSISQIIQIVQKHRELTGRSGDIYKKGGKEQ